MPKFDRTPSDVNRRALLRAGLVGAAGIGAAAATCASTTADEYSANQTCPAWLMGTSQGQNGTIYSYYCYYFDGNCMPVLSDWSELDSSIQLSTGCDGNCVGSYLKPPGKQTPAPQPRTATGTLTINHHFYPQDPVNLAAGLPEYHPTITFPDCEILYDKTHKFKAAATLVRLVAARYKWSFGKGNQQITGEAIVAVGRETDPNGGVPTGSSQGDDIDPGTIPIANSPNYQVISRAVPALGGTIVTFHTLLRRS